MALTPSSGKRHLFKIQTQMKKSTTSHILFSFAAILLFALPVFSQNLPSEWQISDDGKRLTIGGLPSTGFYDEEEIQTLELWFTQPNYWSLLTNNYNSSTNLGALMIANGDTLASPVGVRFKGFTSYFMIPNSQKKSFNITLDFADPDQHIDGYKTLNLNNCYEDPSFLREFLYLHLSRKHTPAAKASYIQLYINGQSWGIYPSIQALNSSFLREWFLSKDGTRWRAQKDPNIQAGGFFGTGYSSLNWLGNADTTQYKKYYTLKKTHQLHPWEDLVRTCDKLNNTPLSSLEDTIQRYLDLDRTLWFLASEIAFSDDDSYVNKGGMDYYLYWEPETGRMVPLEYDGNSAMDMVNVNWSPFRNTNDVRFPLLNKLLAVPSIRQRYLAHLRTIIEEGLEQARLDSLIDNYFDLIDPLVAADTKKLYSYTAFKNEKSTLKNYVQKRRTALLGNAEVNVQGLEISAVQMNSAGGSWVAPAAGESVNVRAQVSGAAGIGKVYLYYATGLVGRFEKTEMFDDGNHGDGAADDAVFGGTIPGYSNGTQVRFYIEAIANNSSKTATYMPTGAEHDVFFFKTGITEYFNSEVVINEIMASNNSSVADQDGEYDDWIELFNNSSSAIDLSGWYLSDDNSLVEKWIFPDGTVINGNDYLIIWADKDEAQAGLHASFKLSASGESLYLLNPQMSIGQEVTFGQQQTDLAYARIPNGTGDFVFQAHTFNANNEGTSATNDPDAAGEGFHLLPNPAREQVLVRVNSSQSVEVQVFSALGQLLLQEHFCGEKAIGLNGWQPGVYFLRIGQHLRKLVVE